MSGSLGRVRTTVGLVQAQQLPFLAAAIAYYTFLSVVPLLVVALTVATAVAGEAVATELLTTLDRYLTPETADLLESTLVEPEGRGGVTAAGLLVLLWSSLRVFRGIDIAFSQVYDTATDKSLVEQVCDALLVLVAISLAVTATLGGTVLLSLAPAGLGGLLGSVGLLVALPVVFFPLYYVFPAEDVAAAEAVPGAVFAGLAWTVLGTAFGVYASQAGSFQLYGVLGGLVLLLVWFYAAGLVLLAGAALNAVLAGRLRDRQLQQGGSRRDNQRATMGEDDRPAGDREHDSDAAGSRDDDQTADGGPSGGRRPDGGVSRGVAPGGDDSGPGDAASDVPGDDGDDDGSEEGVGHGYPGVRSLQLERGDIPAGQTPADRTFWRGAVTKEELADLRRQVEAFEEEIDDRTVHRDELEADLKRYVRGRVRRSHARGWGPYLVLLYGTAMTLAAFFFLGGGWAILAMLVIWLSTLGLYALMVVVGVTAATLRLPGRVTDWLRGLR